MATAGTSTEQPIGGVDFVSMPARDLEQAARF